MSPQPKTQNRWTAEMLEKMPEREIDALVAKHVMEWHIETVSDFSANLGPFLNYVSAEGIGMVEVDGWYPSSDIAAAMQLFDDPFPVTSHYIEMSAGYMQRNGEDITNGWTVTIIGPGLESRAQHESLPRAICIAALLALPAPSSEKKPASATDAGEGEK